MKNVSLFIPCLVDLVLPDIGEATVSLLRHLDCRPVYHEQQTCCGLFSFNAGFRDEARRMARRFIEVFGDDEVVVCPSGSCVNMVRNRYPELFRNEPEWLERAKALSGRVYELTQLIVDVLGVSNLGAAYSGKVAYHESCNMLGALGISEQPKKLIRAVRGTELLPMKDADVCCGFGGEFSNNYPEISEALVAAKTASYLESGADLLVLCEPGCLLNVSGYLSRRHPAKKAAHIATFLAGSLSA
ncbi:MAG: (Fe-S)-binding protein [bacterium]